VITEKEFEQRRENFERQWYPTVGGTGPRLQRMRTSDWCARENGRISENCLFSWLFGNTTPDRAEPNDSYALMFAKIFMRRRRFEDMAV